MTPTWPPTSPASRKHAIVSPIKCRSVTFLAIPSCRTLMLGLAWMVRPSKCFGQESSHDGLIVR